MRKDRLSNVKVSKQEATKFIPIITPKSVCSPSISVCSNKNAQPLARPNHRISTPEKIEPAR